MNYYQALFPSLHLEYKALVDQLSELGYLPRNKDSGEFNVLFPLTSMQESFWNWIQITDCFTNERIDLSMIVYFIALFIV